MWSFRPSRTPEATRSNGSTQQTTLFSARRLIIALCAPESAKRTEAAKRHSAERMHNGDYQMTRARHARNHARIERSEMLKRRARRAARRSAAVEVIEIMHGRKAG